MKTFKKIISIIMVAAVIATICVMGTVTSGASGTGAGLAEWALNAYNSGWRYVYGGSTPGTVDCSGLIYSYAGGYRGGNDQTFNASYRGYLSNGIPNIHGLGLYKPGHVGVYVGNGMAVDARGDAWGVCYESVWSHGWTQYFKVPGVYYPDNGWVQFNGEYYYYENGEYLADTSRTIDGETYYFASSGASSTTPSDTDAKADDSKQTTTTKTETKAEDNGPLKNGSKGSKVEKLQTRLQELGYYNGIIDGDFGDMTEKAFKLFQKAAGLYVDGIAGSDADLLYADDAPYYTAETKDTKIDSEKAEIAETGEKAEEDTTDAEADEADEDADEDDGEMHFAIGDTDEDIIPIQERLITLGYLDSEADGAFGAQTEAAVIDFQGSNSIAETGIVDQQTYDILFSNVAVKNVTEEPTETETVAATEPVEKAAQASETVTNTEVEQKTSELGAKSVAAVTNSMGFQRGANATNFEFLLWLAIMIVVMLITFTIVYAVEKKKMRATARAGRRFQ